MTDAQLERLALLVEEAAEVQQIAMKIIRHGAASYNPFDETMTSNRNLLEKELGDLQFAIKLMAEKGDIYSENIHKHQESKVDRVRQYLHHNKV